MYDDFKKMIYILIVVVAMATGVLYGQYIGENETKFKIRTDYELLKEYISKHEIAHHKEEYGNTCQVKSVTYWYEDNKIVDVESLCE
jgi:hypothetical protein